MRSSEPPALVSPRSSLCISVVSGRRTALSHRAALFLLLGASVRLGFFSQISSSSLRIGGAWVVGGPLQVLSHLSGWHVTDGGGLRGGSVGWAPSSPHGSSGGSALRFALASALKL
ncbi:hypothetical protein Bca4012_042659 [Brassica carinata]|uniref:Uncharacterized protein n=1 Tax=Brassica carinata TaxID=52824 RepID=A0A8X7QVV1_BRACI|nr:hypothetical protein Bca52824_059616 [Brassica carinata]